MKKKIIILLIIILLLVAGGIFWWQDQTEVRELNKNLPEGVRVVKSLIGKDYKVVNKIDEYKVKLPEGWEGLKEVKYIPERTVKELKVASINLTGNLGGFIAIDCYKLEKANVNLEIWVNELMQNFDLQGVLEKEIIGNFEIIKTKEEEHLAGMFLYFLKKNSRICILSGFSEEFIRSIILNSKW